MPPTPVPGYQTTLTRVVLAPPLHLVCQIQAPAPPVIVAARYRVAPGVTVEIESGAYYIAKWDYNIDALLELYWDTLYFPS